MYKKATKEVKKVVRETKFKAYDGTIDLEQKKERFLSL